MSPETIYALSSGHPPAAIAIVRISGPHAMSAVEAMAGRLPAAREAGLRSIRHPATNEMIDRAILLCFPGPGSATGEDLAELHLHGGRAVVAGILDALATFADLRPALAGEFTRRAFENGRIDLAEAEGLADLLAAETHSQRRAALTLAGGSLSRQVATWQERLLDLSAGVEAQLDFSDEGDVSDALPAHWFSGLARLVAELESLMQAPPVERLRDGVRVVIAGPPNVGKSSLLNRLVGRPAAITSAIAGTTRDAIEAPASIDGTPIVLVDTAGLRDSTDEVEAAGVALAFEHVNGADLLLWLGEPTECPFPDRAIVVASKADLHPEQKARPEEVRVSALTGDGIALLLSIVLERARSLLPAEGTLAINARHREALAEVLANLFVAQQGDDPLIVSESLRAARAALDRVTGRAGVEAMLDRLFGAFCVGK